MSNRATAQEKNWDLLWHLLWLSWAQGLGLGALGSGSIPWTRVILAATGRPQSSGQECLGQKEMVQLSGEGEQNPRGAAEPGVRNTVSDWTWWKYWCGVRSGQANGHSDTTSGPDEPRASPAFSSNLPRVLGGPRSRPLYRQGSRGSEKSNAISHAVRGRHRTTYRTFWLQNAVTQN